MYYTYNIPNSIQKLGIRERQRTKPHSDLENTRGIPHNVVSIESEASVRQTNVASSVLAYPGQQMHQRQDDTEDNHHYVAAEIC